MKNKYIEIAVFMKKEIEHKKYLDYYDIANKIKKEYGEAFVRKNEAHEWIMLNEIVEEFKAITEKDVVWEGGKNKGWRLREKYDGPGRRAQ